MHFTSLTSKAMPLFNRSRLFHHHHHRSSPQGDMEMSDFQHHKRHSGKSSSASSSSSAYDYDDSIDAITPCPLLETIASNQRQHSHLHDIHQSQYRQTQSKKCVGGPLSRNSSQKRPVSRCESWRSTQPRPFQGYIGDNNEDDEELDTEILWKQMLAVQDRFGCYNSARMRAALEGGDSSIPSRICLDLINDSIGDMPEDVRQRIELFLEREGSGAMMKKGKWKRFWHRVIYI